MNRWACYVLAMILAVLAVGFVWVAGNAERCGHMTMETHP